MKIKLNSNYKVMNELPFYRDPFDLFSTLNITFSEKDNDITKINVIARWIIYIGCFSAVVGNSVKPFLFMILFLIIIAICFIFKIKRFYKMQTIDKFSSKKLTHDEFNALQQNAILYDPQNPNVQNMNRLILESQIKKRGRNNAQERYDILTKDVNKRNLKKVVGNYTY
jgi:hypothetical protein